MKRRFLSEVRWRAAWPSAGLTAPALAEPDAVKLFAEHCAACHGADRLGGQGPALLPENLGRLMGPRAAAVIADGRAATQMPGFGAKLEQGRDRGAGGLYCDAARRDTCRGAAQRSPPAGSSMPPRRRSTGRASRPIR